MKTLNIALVGLRSSGKTSLVKKLQQRTELETENVNVYSYKAGDALVYLSDTVYEISKPKPTLVAVNQADACLICVSAIDPLGQNFGELVLLLKFSGVKDAVVAITKTDSADPDQIESLKSKLSAVLSQAGISNSEFFETSTITDTGFLELREALAQLTPKSRDRTALAKMTMDSAREIKSGLTTVTGVLDRGSIKKYDKVVIMPWGKEFIVQELQVYGEIVEKVDAGNRCSASFKGLYPWDVQIGDLVAAEGFLHKAKSINIELEVTPFFKDDLKPDAEVEVNIGTQTLTATVKALSKDKLSSGEKGQIIVESKLPFAYELGQSCIVINPNAHWRSIKVVGSGKVIGEA